VFSQFKISIPIQFFPIQKKQKEFEEKEVTAPVSVSNFTSFIRRIVSVGV